LIIASHRLTVPRHRPPPTADPPKRKTRGPLAAALEQKQIESSSQKFLTLRPASAQAVTNRPPTFSPPIADRARQTPPVDSGGNSDPTRHTAVDSVCRKGCTQWWDSAPHLRPTARRRNLRADRHLEGRSNRAALAAAWSPIPSTTESGSPHRGLLVPMARDGWEPGARQGRRQWRGAAVHVSNRARWAAWPSPPCPDGARPMNHAGARQGCREWRDTAAHLYGACPAGALLVPGQAAAATPCKTVGAVR
jgi:hypothetical protein